MKLSQDKKTIQKLAKFDETCEQMRRYLTQNIDFQGHMQVNFFTGKVANWNALQVFKAPKDHNSEMEV